MPSLPSLCLHPISVPSPPSLCLHPHLCAFTSISVPSLPSLCLHPHLLPSHPSLSPHLSAKSPPSLWLHSHLCAFTPISVPSPPSLFLHPITVPSFLCLLPHLCTFISVPSPHILLGCLTVYLCYSLIDPLLVFLDQIQCTFDTMYRYCGLNPNPNQ